MTIRDTKTRHCDFCNRNEHEASKFIAGPEVFICDMCIVMCCQIIICTDNPKIEKVDNIIKDTDSK